MKKGGGSDYTTLPLTTGKQETAFQEECAELRVN